MRMLRNRVAHEGDALLSITQDQALNYAQASIDMISYFDFFVGNDLRLVAFHFRIFDWDRFRNDRSFQGFLKFFRFLLFLKIRNDYGVVFLMPDNGHSDQSDQHKQQGVECS